MAKRKNQKFGDSQKYVDDQERLQADNVPGDISPNKSYYHELLKKTKELDEERNKYERNFSNVLCGIFQAELNGRIIIANPAMVKICGYNSKEQFNSISDIGKQLFANHDQKDKLVKILLDKKTVHSFETKFKRNDGTIINVSLNAALQTSPTGEYLECFVEDITESKQTEMALAEKTIMLDNILRSANNTAIATTDLNFRITYYNPAAEKFFGYSAKEVIGKKIQEMHTKERVDPERFEKAIEAVRQNGEYNFILEQQTTEGIRYLESRITGIFDSKGKMTGFALFSCDITECKRSERRIDHLNLVLQAIRNVNQLITKEKDRDILLKGACKNLIETRGYYYAWIALFEESGKFITVAAVGMDQDFSSMAKMLESGRMAKCAKTALKNSNIGIIENPETECKDCPLAKKFPGKGRMTIRLEYEGKIYGLMTVSIPVEFIKDKEEHNLLKEVAGDIAFALYNIEVEKERKQTEKHNRFLSTVVMQSADGMAVANMEGDLLFVNNKWVSMHGYEKEEELLGQKLSIFHNKKQLKDDVELFNLKVMEKGFYTGEVGHIRKDGTIFPTQMTSTLLMDENNNAIAIAGVATDITERKQAEEALRKSEARYRLLFNLLPYGGEVINTKGKIVNCSPSTAKMLGYEVSELIGKHITEFLDPDYINAFRRKFPQLLSGKPTTVEICMIRKDGKKLNILRAAQPILDNNGKVEAVLALNVDITERKKVEGALKESEEKYRIVVENAGEMIWRVDTQGNFVFFNKYAEQLSSQKSADWQGKHYTSFIHPDDLAHVNKIHNEAILGNNMEYETRIFVKSGKTVYLEIQVLPIYIKGEVVGTLNFGRDITERKKAEEALHQAHSQLTATLNALPDLMFEVDRDGYIHDYHAPHQELLYVPPEKFLGKTIYEILPIEAAQVIGKAIAEAVATGRHIGATYELLLPTGPSWFELSIATKGDPNTPTGRFIGLARDITERKQAEEALIKAKEHAEESDRLKSAFLANMSHEIRTPMNGILGFAELLKEPKLTGEEQQKYINIIQTSGVRMLNIINDLIDISKIESGQMEVSVSEININQQIEYIYTFFKPEVERKKMQLFFNNSLPAKKAIIKTDREKIFAILTNLVKNAIKYSVEGSILFGYEKKGNYLEFFVKDTGIGIVHNKQQAIFERFIQADVSDKQAFHGAGLGLSITKSYVEMLGGKIWVESEVGKGTQFYFTIPYKTKKQEKINLKEGFSNSIKVGKIKNLKILIAEDEKIARTYLSIIIKNICKEIMFAKTGIEAVELCRNNQNIDLILMDIKMPEMDGYEATHKIREFNKDIIIIAQTAYALTEDKKKAIKAGCNDYLTKPINKDELMVIIAKHFNFTAKKLS